MTVEWDDYYQAAYFTDWDSIAAQIDENFSILNTILALDGDRWDPEQTYRVKELVSGSMTLYGETEAENGTAAMSLAVDGLVRGGQADLDMKLDLDLGELKELVTGSMLEEDTAALDLLSDFEMEVRGDLGQGTLYMTGNKLGDIPGSTVGSGEWLSLDLGQSIDVAALVEALEAAQSEPLTVGDLLAAGPRENGTGWYWAPPCTQVLDKAEKLALFLGDDCFTVSTSGSTTTYTLKVDTLSLADKLSGLTVEDETGELSLLLDYLKGDLKVDCSGTIKVRDNKLVDMDVRFTVKLPASVTAGMPVDITFAVSGDSTGAECTLTAKGRLRREAGAESGGFCGKDQRHACRHASGGSGDPHPGRVSGLRRRIPDGCRMGTDERQPVTNGKNPPSQPGRWIFYASGTYGMSQKPTAPQAAPIMAPASTSLGKWTPPMTRISAMSTPTASNTPPRGGNIHQKAMSMTKTENTWRLGKELPLVSLRMSGVMSSTS